MASCEKCWRDSRRAEYEGDHMAYQRLLRERDARGEQCTPEQQAGEDASECPICKRMTVHQYAEVCMICSWRPSATHAASIAAGKE